MSDTDTNAAPTFHTRTGEGQHQSYNVTRYPILLCRGSSNWWIYSTEDLKYCAAIAVKPGCDSSTFGSIGYFIGHISRHDRDRAGLTSVGLKVVRQGSA